MSETFRVCESDQCLLIQNSDTFDSCSLISEKRLLASVHFFWFQGFQPSSGSLFEGFSVTGYQIFTRQMSSWPCGVEQTCYN